MLCYAMLCYAMLRYATSYDAAQYGDNMHCDMAKPLRFCTERMVEMNILLNTLFSVLFFNNSDSGIWTNQILVKSRLHITVICHAFALCNQSTCQSATLFDHSLLNTIFEFRYAAHWGGLMYLPACIQTYPRPHGEDGEWLEKPGFPPTDGADREYSAWRTHGTRQKDLRTWRSVVRYLHLRLRSWYLRRSDFELEVVISQGFWDLGLSLWI